MHPEWSSLLGVSHDPEATLGAKGSRFPDPATTTTRSRPASDPGSLPTRATGRIANAEVGSGGRPFRIIGPLGRGGFGEVVLAEQVTLRREVAVKILARSDAGRRNAFRRESVLCAGLEHPHIVPIHDAGDDFLVMKRLGGRTLETALRGETDPARRAAIAAETLIAVADALAYAHDRGVVHRDVKPANIMLGAHGEVWLLDWGLARRRDEADDEATRCAGTPAFLSPETARCEPSALEPAADVFLLGATLFCAIAGRPPWQAASVADCLALAAAGTVPPLPETAPRLAALCRAAMDPDPTRRPTAAGVAEGLRTWLRSSRGEVAAATACRAAAAAIVAGDPRRGAAAYAALAEARTHLDRAAALCPDLPGLAATRDGLSAASVRAAIAAGDLGLAALRLGEEAGPGASAARTELVRACRRRERRDRHAVFAKRFSVAAVAFLAGIGLASLALERHARGKAAAVRVAEARALLGGAAPVPDSTAAFEDAIDRAERAAGLDPAGGGEAALTATRLAYGRWALQRNDRAQAEAQRAVLPPQAASALGDEIAAAERRRDEARRDRHEALGRVIDTVALRRWQVRDDDRILADDATALLVAWSPPDDHGRDAALRRMVDAAADAADRILRQVSVRTRCLRAGLGGAEPALPALREVLTGDAVAASRQIMAIQEPALRWRHLAELAARSGEDFWENLPDGIRAWCYPTVHARRDELREQAKAGITPRLRADVAELAAAWYVLEGGGFDAWRILGDDPEALRHIAELENDYLATCWSMRQALVSNDKAETVRVANRFLVILQRKGITSGSEVDFVRGWIDSSTKPGAVKPEVKALEEQYQRFSNLEAVLEPCIAQRHADPGAETMVEGLLGKPGELTANEAGLVWEYLIAVDRQADAFSLARRIGSADGVGPNDRLYARTLLELGRAAEAELDCAHRLAFTPGDPDLLLLRADCMVALHRAGEAEAIWLDLGQRGQLGGIDRLAERQRQRGDYRTSVATSLRLLQLTTHEAAHVLFKGAAGANQGGFAGDEAVLMRRVLELVHCLDASAAPRLGRILLGAGAPQAALTVISGVEDPAERREALAQLALAIPALRGRPLPGEDGPRQAWRCLGNALSDAAITPVPGLAPPRPGLWLELAARQAGGDTRIAAVSAIITAAIANDPDRVTALLTSTKAQLGALPERHLDHELTDLVKAASATRLVRPWFRELGWTCHPLPDLVPDRAWLDEAIRIWHGTGDGPTPFDTLAPGPDLPPRTIDAVIRSLPRAAEAAHAP